MKRTKLLETLQKRTPLLQVLNQQAFVLFISQNTGTEFSIFFKLIGTKSYIHAQQFQSI